MTKTEEIRLIDLGGDGVPSLHIRPLINFDYTPSKASQPEPPHKHNFQELIWIRSGRGQQAIDGDITDIKPATFYLIAKGQVHQFLEAEKVNGFVLQFNEEFRLRRGSGQSRHFSETFFNNVRSIPALSIEGEQIQSLEALFTLISHEFDSPHRIGQQAVLRHLLQVLLIKITQNIDEGKVGEEKTEPAQDTIFKDFLSLLEDQFQSHHDVAFYADSLAITPRQLSDRTKRVVGKTAKQVIEDRVTLEAKRALRFTSRPVKEIAYDLGFDDPSYFSKVFKRVTGHTPQEFQDL